MALALSVMEKREAKRWRVLSEEGTKNFCIGRNIQLKRDLICFIRGSGYSGCVTKATSISASKYLLPLITQALDPQSATQLFNLAHEDRPKTKQKKQRRLAMGTSQPRDHLPFEQDSHHLGEDQEGSPLGACPRHRPH